MTSDKMDSIGSNSDIIVLYDRRVVDYAEQKGVDVKSSLQVLGEKMLSTFGWYEYDPKRFIDTRVVWDEMGGHLEEPVYVICGEGMHIDYVLAYVQEAVEDLDWLVYVN